MSDTTKIAHRFWSTYERLSLDGFCDSPGGMEFTRVQREWRSAAYPEPLGEFIHRRANAIPGPDDDFEDWVQIPQRVRVEGS